MLGKPLKTLLLIYICASLFGTGCAEHNPEDTEMIAVTNSYLASAVMDIAGPDIKVVTLASPGMCPGHFDISPRQVTQLRQSAALLIFDFQQSLNSTLSRLTDEGLKIATVKSSEGMSIPHIYLQTSRQVKKILADIYPDRKETFENNFAALETCLAKISDEISIELQNAGIENTKVISSAHQESFAEYLGLDVVATFTGQDTETISRINSILTDTREQEIQFVIANMQEGTDLAKALAEQLDAQVVIFSNFPDSDYSQSGFEGLFRENTQNLLQAAK